MIIRIGSRGSDLALWQANFIKEKLEDFNHEVEITVIKTQGDKIQDLSFEKMEGKGFFTKELEQALLDEEIDLAVHSYKDLETTQPEGLAVTSVSERANPADLILVHPHAFDENEAMFVKAGAVIGTSSARRQSQVLKWGNNLELKDLRGNVPTRIKKLQNGEYDAIILAAAGIERLNFDTGNLIVKELPLDKFVPAPGQGVLAFQVLGIYELLREALFLIDDVEVYERTNVERGILKGLNGGCQLPLGAYCTSDLKDDWKVTVSYAKTRNEPATIYNFQANSEEALIEIALKTLKNL